MKRILIAVLALSLTSSVLGANEIRKLDEAMTPKEFSGVYKPLKTAAHKALDAKEFDKAFHLFVKAGKASAFSWVRARQFANAAFALARTGNRCGEAITWYNEALRIQQTAEKKASGGPKWSKARAQTRLDIEWGLFDSACAPKKKSK